MARKAYDVIVVGAGPGGVACAGLLAKGGMKTLLLEKNARPGGKALTMARGGYRYELWPVIGAPRIRFEQLIKELGLDLEFVLGTGPAAEAGEGTHAGGFIYRYPSGEYGPYQPPGPEPLSPEESAELGRLFSDINAMTPEALDELDLVSFDEFIGRYRVPQALYSYLAVWFNIVFVVPIDLLPASEAIKTFRDIMSGAGGATYFRGGYGRLAEECAEAVKRYGGEVKLRTKVEQILIEDGQVRGVVTDKGAFNAPIVVSNAGIQPTVLKLAGEEHFDQGYVNYIKDLVPSLALLGHRYFLSKPVWKSHSYIVYSNDSPCNMERYLRAKAGEIPEDPLVIVFVPSVSDPGLAPPGKQCAQSATLCPSDPKLKNPQKWFDKLDEMVAKIWPDVPQYIERKETYGPADVSRVTRDSVLPGQGGECIGLGQVVGQCGRFKPSAKAPLRGLFYVGVDAGGYGCGTHQGVESAFNVARMVLQYHQTRQTI